MLIFKTNDSVSAFIDKKKSLGKTIGFVPTMGALHDGHLSLIKRSKEQNDLTVCSIFVNPTQFNNPEDFKHYPVTIEKDLERLLSSGCDVLFLPLVSEIYPQNHIKKEYSLGKIETILEGYYRPGHFQGVCEVVERLLIIINPDRLYLGQKDYQQCMVVKQLLKLIDSKLELIIAPTLREEDGLAMSSRNLRLSAEERKRSIALYQALNYIKRNIKDRPFSVLKEEAKKQLEKEGFSVDYVEIADAYTLEPADSNSRLLVGLIAATINKIRLIDNMPLN